MRKNLIERKIKEIAILLLGYILTQKATECYSNGDKFAQKITHLPRKIPNE